MFSFVCVFLIAVGCRVVAEGAALSPSCNQGRACLLPDCRCSNSGIPGGFSSDRIPQMVILTFEGHLSEEAYQNSKQLLGVTNSNGCTVSVTYFVDLLRVNLSHIIDLEKRGVEIAVLGNFTKMREGENGGQTSITNTVEDFRNVTGLSLENIRGWRSVVPKWPAPEEVKSLLDNGFVYDSSAGLKVSPADPGRTDTFPLTVRRGAGGACYPGLCQHSLWRLPRKAVDPQVRMLCEDDSVSEGDILSFILTDFYSLYSTERYPVIFNYPMECLESPGFVTALRSFFEFTLRLPDVFFVSISQSIAWTENPQDISRIPNFEPWQRTCGALTNEGGRSKFLSNEKEKIFDLQESVDNAIKRQRPERPLDVEDEDTSAERREFMFIIIFGTMGFFVFVAVTVFICHKVNKSAEGTPTLKDVRKRKVSRGLYPGHHERQSVMYPAGHFAGQPAEHSAGHIAAHSSGNHRRPSAGHSAEHSAGHLEKHSTEHFAGHPERHRAEHSAGHHERHSKEHSAGHHKRHSVEHSTECRMLSHHERHSAEHSAGHIERHSTEHSLGHAEIHPEEHSAGHPERHSVEHSLGHHKRHSAEESAGRHERHPAEHSAGRLEIHPEEHSAGHLKRHSAEHFADHLERRPAVHFAEHLERHSTDISTGHPKRHSAEHSVGHIERHSTEQSAGHHKRHSAGYSVGHHERHSAEHSAGHPKRHSAEHSVGHIEKHQTEHSAGQHKRHSAGYSAGHHEGHSAEHSAGHPKRHSAEHSVGRIEKHRTEHSAGHHKRHSAGYSAGHHEGHSAEQSA